MEQGSFILVILLGLLLCWRALNALYHTLKSLRPVPAMRITQYFNRRAASRSQRSLRLWPQPCAE
jgi:ABC-type nickel/cobalt efflux system permease component RcnA